VQHTRIPRGLLKAICYPGGTRLPQLNTLPLETTEAMAVSVFVSPTRSLEIVPVTSVPMLGNLTNEAYRFFRGDRSRSSTFFQCRGCLEEEMELSAKVPHVKNCRPMMQAIVSLLERDSLCVVCNHYTYKKCWTVPLCSEACNNRFRFDIPPAWLHARNIVVMRGATEREILA
jgi:hypothetical protein